MTNHIHLIARAKENYKLSHIIRDFKKFTANKLLDYISRPLESRSDWMLKRLEFAAGEHGRNSKYQIRTHENHAIELYSIEFIEQKLNYIRVGIVDKPEDYIFSSARNYSGLEEKVEIDYLF